MSFNPSNQSAHNRVTIFDTTLRDGEQSPGASMNLEQKVRLAQALGELRVDVMEVGFPVASPGDFEAVRAVCQNVHGPVMCGLARANRKDIDRTWDALKDAPKKRIHVFLATSPLHREYKLKMSREEVLRRSVEAVAYARERFDDVQFSAEDAARTEIEFLIEVVERVIDAGATTVNIPDTVGYALPSLYGALAAALKRQVRNIDKAVLSVHCHNDLGLAVANTLAALTEGARQVECTVNGIGERAGNSALEEVVMALHTRQDVLGLTTGIKTERLYPTSRLLASVTGMQVQRNKAVVGQNAFAHEAGIHQHGMLAHPGTYEIMKPEDVGFPKSHLVLGKHSGRHSLRQRLKELGHLPDDALLDSVFDQFKILADRKKEVSDADLEALVRGQGAGDRVNLWKLVSLQSVTSSDGAPRAEVRLEHNDGRIVDGAASGNGPLDALFKAIQKVMGVTVQLCDYRVSRVDLGGDARGEVSVEVEHKGRRLRARAVDTDVIIGSAEAFLEALNRIALESTGPSGTQKEFAA